MNGSLPSPRCRMQIRDGWDIALQGDSRWRRLIRSPVQDVYYGCASFSPKQESWSYHELPVQDKANIRLIMSENSGEEFQTTPMLLRGSVVSSSQRPKGGTDKRYPITTYEAPPFPIALRYMRLFENENEYLQMHIIYSTYFAPSKGLYAGALLNSALSSHVGSFVRELAILDTIYVRIRTLSNWKQVFLLQIYQASLRTFAEFLGYMMRQHQGADEDQNMTSNPTKKDLRALSLGRMKERALEIIRLEEAGRELTSTTKSLIDLVKTQLPIDDLQIQRLFMIIETELQGHFKAINRQLLEISCSLDRDLKTFEKTGEIDQTRRIQQLTIIGLLSLLSVLATRVLWFT